MPLGMDVDIGIGHVVLDGDLAPLPPPKGTQHPLFRPTSIAANDRTSQLLLRTCYTRQCRVSHYFTMRRYVSPKIAVPLGDRVPQLMPKGISIGSGFSHVQCIVNREENSPFPLVFHQPAGGEPSHIGNMHRKLVRSRAWFRRYASACSALQRRASQSVDTTFRRSVSPNSLLSSVNDSN